MPGAATVAANAAKATCATRTSSAANGGVASVVLLAGHHDGRKAGAAYPGG